MNSKHGKYNSAHTAKRFMAAGTIAVVLVCASTAARADISISPQTPAAGSIFSVSACINIGAHEPRFIGEPWIDPSGVFVELDGKPVNNSNTWGYCGDGFSAGFGAGAIVSAYWHDNRTPATPVPAVLVNAGAPGDHMLTITAEFKDGSRERESKVIHVTPLPDAIHAQMQAAPGAPNPPIQWGGSPGASLSPTTKPMAQMGAAPAPAWSGPAATAKRSVPFITLSLSHGPSGSQVQVSACSVPGPQGSQYAVSVDNVNAYLNLPIAACGAGKFGFGAGTSLPAITVTVTGSPASRHTINVTNLGSATFIVDP